MLFSLPLLSFVLDEREMNPLHSPQVVPRQVRTGIRNNLSIKLAFPFYNQGPDPLLGMQTTLFMVASKLRREGGKGK